jgi:CRP-like cAMP-binding protein
VNSVISRLNIGHYKKLLANQSDIDKQQILQRLLSGEKTRLASSLKQEAEQGNRLAHDLSSIQIHGCNQSLVRSGILQLRRGPIFHPRKHSVFLQGDRADHIIIVVDGVIRTCRYGHAGRRNVLGFYVKGDTLGWNDSTLRSLTAEAATDSTLLYIKRSSLIALASRNPQVNDFILTATKNELYRTQEYSLLVTKDSKSRVTTFLLDFWNRTGKPNPLKLPMKYQDIADHLGLTLESVSRTINLLIREGVFRRVSCRELALRSRSALERMAGQDRS